MMQYAKVSLFLFVILSIGINYIYAEPAVNDINFIVEEFSTGLEFPTALEFVDNDVLILQRLDGKVLHYTNGKLVKTLF